MFGRVVPPLCILFLAFLKDKKRLASSDVPLWKSLPSHIDLTALEKVMNAYFS
jgi:hypothetical protein